MEEPIKTEESTVTKTEEPHVKTEEKLKEKSSEVVDNTLNSSIKKERDSNVNKVVKSHQVLKRKYTEDGVAIERVLSEGETSSGFETVSSVDSNVDIDELDDLELSSLSDCQNDYKEKFNVIVHIENELAYRNVKESDGRTIYWNDCRSVIHDHRKDYNSNLHSKKRFDSERGSKEQKYWGSSSENKYYKSDRRRWSSEREGTDHSRQPSSHDSDRKTQDWNRRLKRSDIRSRCSRSSERSRRRRSSRSSERNVWFRTSTRKDRRAESRLSGSFDKYSSYQRRNSPPTKRRRSSTSRSLCSVWSRLDSRVSPTGAKKEEIIKSKKDSSSKPSRKKERTPFLVELERKLKEAERLKNSKKESTNESKDQTKTTDATDTVPMLQMPVPIHQIPNPLYPTTFPTIPFVQGVYTLQYQPVPTLSVDNLPLVPGPTGLPVHVTVTGEQIPHDMDGKRIPVGPNGFYLPVDPTGRLFAHIISPANQAIPIHMTDDGVLRLPNSEPVPYGPCHQLPVNVDGSVIFIGPDSKPLYPCHNLPRSPPLNLINMIHTFGCESTGQQETVQMMPQAEIQQIVPPQPQPQTQSQTIKSNFNFIFQSSESDLNVSNITSNPPEENNNDSLNNNKKVSGEEVNSLECIQTGKKLGTQPKAGVKRSIPFKLLQKKADKEKSRNRGSDNILVTSPSAPELKCDVVHKNCSNGSSVISSEKKDDFLEIVCGNKSFRIRTSGFDSDDPIVGKTQQAIKSLSELNYNPPPFGRFIISNLSSGLVVKKNPNESPLTRNRIKLPFVTPNAKDFYCPKEPVSVDRTEVTFKFLPQKSEKGEKTSIYKYKSLHSTSATKFPVFTFDFAVQCDFTSVIIKNLNSKITELEMEVVRLKKVNANLLDDCKNAQAKNEKNSDELRKAMLEIEEKKYEIKALKGSLESTQG